MKSFRPSRTDPGNVLLTDAQLEMELAKCAYCAEKPCLEACPCHCSPADFIMAARVGAPQDYQRAAELIYEQNPFGGVCGMVCPDRFCMQACSRARLDAPVNIPAVQATVIARALEMGSPPKLEQVPPNGKRVAVIGAGPTGLSAAQALAQKGYRVDVFDLRETGGGTCHTIPRHRLQRNMLKNDVERILQSRLINFRGGDRIDDPTRLLRKGYGAVVVAVGLSEPIRLGISGEELAIPGLKYLEDPGRFRLRGRVAVVGGGATALDCAVTARKRGAAKVEMICLEKLGEMPLSTREKEELFEYGIEVTGRTRVMTILGSGGRVRGIETVRVMLPAGEPFNLRHLSDVKGTERLRGDVTRVIVAVGARPGMPRKSTQGVFFAGDCEHGPSTVVEAAAAGKNVALRVDAYLSGQRVPRVKDMRRSTLRVPGYKAEPVSLECEFLGRKLSAPFLISACPASDGFDQVRRAYEAGWPGVIMKTAFDGLPIHIPAAYMNCFSPTTWGNCDNVSDHPLRRVCREVRRLVRLYPDRLTGASTGGTVSGDEEADRRSWQNNTRRLEDAGAMLIEYSLSCPQGGEGAEGDIVSQNAALTARIIEWVLEAADPRVPKLFKLTSAVTDIRTILRAVLEVFGRYPDHRVGVTLANTFPSLRFQPSRRKGWDEGVVVGMSGEGVTPISYLCLANAGGMGITISGNAGPMNYRAAADFLALGASTVQFCTIVEKYGYGIITELRSGLSHLLAARGLQSVAELVGIAQPHPIREFMDLDAEKKISSCDRDLCVQCGNCTRCPYLAISLDGEGYPVTDPARCIGCSLCVLQCFAGALTLRRRTDEERAALQESHGS